MMKVRLWALIFALGLATTAPAQQATEFNLGSDWQFAPDPGDVGEKEGWYGDTFSDASWQTLKSGISWEKQGVTCHGWGWFRQKVAVPQAATGTPLQLELGTLPSDDYVWFNGTRIGGIRGEHKYVNWRNRIYTVPASLIRYGQDNTLAIRVWGGNITFIGANSGLVKGPFKAKLDPYIVRMREPGGEAVPAQLFDLSDAQRGKPFEIVFSFPIDAAKASGAQLSYSLTDMTGHELLKTGTTPLAATGPVPQGVVAIDRDLAQTLYCRGRFQAQLTVKDASGQSLYAGTEKLDQLSFAKRDNTPLPVLPEEKTEDTPYGPLRLIDEIDCSTSLLDDPHPYLQSGFDNPERQQPGTAVNVTVNEILGKKARESDYGWFAYRIGRGKLTPHHTYLVRIEYPEDKPRYCPVSAQSGLNSLDVGWKTGVSPDDVYNNWPLSHAWQWYDIIVPLDVTTVGTFGARSAPAENGVWVYFFNKLKPNAYYAMFSGGPAVARIKLYEIDPEKNAPTIRKPEGLPQRVMTFDWERQPDIQPADVVRYAKLMGYSAVSPIILKWFFANYGEPLNGYDSYNTDSREYWSWNNYDPAAGKAVGPALDGTPTTHERFLEATKQYGIDYIPRFEWGGSKDLPESARAIDPNGKPTKPNRFAPWCANLLNPAAWDDLQTYLDHEIKPYLKDNPQMIGALWRIRCDRLPPSYGPDDLAMFAKETGTTPPGASTKEQATWAATGAGRAQYDDWWHKKREEFHAKLAALMQSYRPGLTLYYFNWDSDKFGIIDMSLTGWGFLKQVAQPPPLGGRAMYEKEEQQRKAMTAADYTAVMHSGDFGAAGGGINRADLGIRPELYKDVTGFQIFAPANDLCYELPDYLNYFQTHDGLAVSNFAPYDEVGRIFPNPQYECSETTPSGSFSMALELLDYFYGDARTLTWTSYTYGRGGAAEHRRFAQAFLALPALPATVVDQGDADVKVRTYPSANGTYVGVAFKGYTAKKLTIKVPAKSGTTVTDLVTGQVVSAQATSEGVQFDIQAAPMELDAYLVK